MNRDTSSPRGTGHGITSRVDKRRLPRGHTTMGPECAPPRSFLYAMGLSAREIALPFVGVVTTWIEAAPCNIALSRQAQAAKKGVAAADRSKRGDWC